MKLAKSQKISFSGALDAGSKNETIPKDIHVKMANTTAEINKFTAWYREGVESLRDRWFSS